MAVDEPSCSEIAINPAGSDRLDTEQIKVAIKVDEGDEADDGGGAKTDARSLAVCDGDPIGARGTASAARV